MSRFESILQYQEDALRRYNRHHPSNYESILSKEAQYEMFQAILGIKKFEHQLIFNACQVFLLMSLL